MLLTEPFALQGQHAFDGTRLWESYINAREGIACNERTTNTISAFTL